MGIIINIDEALKLRTDYNVLKEPLHAMLTEQQEAWERANPIDMLFTRGTLDTFQKTFTSSIGFEHAFAETADFTNGPIFNTEEGFAKTYTSRTFQGSFIITQQVLEDGDAGAVKDNATKFMTRWHADLVEYAMTAISAGFGVEQTWGSAANGGVSRLKLMTADTTDGDIASTTKNPLFSNVHTVVKRDGMTDDQFNAAKQSNIFRAAKDTTNTDTNPAIVIGGDDPGQIAKLADFINQVISTMENYRDDNNKRAGVLGKKTIVAPNDPHLKAALNAAISMDMFKGVPNPAYQIATVETTPYLLDIPQCANGIGFFIVDKAYNAANHGPEFTERIPLTLDADQLKRPKGIVYDGRQRFDINVASWRGIAYCYLGTPEASKTGDWNYKTKFTNIIPVDTFVKPVSVVGTVHTGTGK